MKIQKIALVFISIVFFAPNDWANEEHEEKHKDGPCHKIVEACEAAGFVKGGHKNTPPKGLWVDCFKPVINGTAVTGVTVDAETIAACKAKKAEHKGKHRKERK